MKKLVRAVVALTVLALGVVIVPPAQAKAPCRRCRAHHRGCVLQLSERVNRGDQIDSDAADHERGGQRSRRLHIRVVAYSFSYGPMADALLNAHDEGREGALAD